MSVIFENQNSARASVELKDICSSSSSMTVSYEQSPVKHDTGSEDEEYKEQVKRRKGVGRAPVKSNKCEALRNDSWLAEMVTSAGIGDTFKVVPDCPDCPDWFVQAYDRIVRKPRRGGRVVPDKLDENSLTIPFIISESDVGVSLWISAVDNSPAHSFLRLSTGSGIEGALLVAHKTSSTLGEVIDCVKKTCRNFVFKVLSPLDYKQKAVDLVDKTIVIAASGIGGGGKGRKNGNIKKKIRNAPLSKMFSALGLTKKKKNSGGKTGGNSRRKGKMFTGGGSSMGYMGSKPVADCTKKYAMAISDPFSPAAEGACNINAENACETLKCKTKMYTTVDTGTSGISYCLISPNVANDAPFLWSTNSDFNTIQTTPLSATDTIDTSWSVTNNGNAPFAAGVVFSSGQSNPTCSGRLVSVGVRFRYGGREDAMAGKMYYGVTNRHQSVCTRPASTIASNADTLRNMEGMASVDASKEWTYFSVFGITNAEHDFVDGASRGLVEQVYPYSRGETGYNSNYTYSLGSGNVGIPVAVICGVGMSTGNVIEVEVIVHIEYTGPTVAYGTTPTEVNTGAGKAIASAGLKALNDLSGERRNFGRAFRKAIKVSAPYLIKMVSGAGA